MAKQLVFNEDQEGDFKRRRDTCPSGKSTLGQKEGTSLLIRNSARPNYKRRRYRCERN
jgi:hypothetical protein